MAQFMSIVTDSKLESIEAANYLIQELLAQIETLKQENNQFRDENEALRIQFEAVTLNPRLRQFSEYDVNEYQDNETVAPSHYSGGNQYNEDSGEDNFDNFESKSGYSGKYAETVYSTASRLVQSDLARYQQLQQRVNQLEKEAETNRLENRKLMTNYSKKLKKASASVASCIELVRPYFAEKKTYIDNRMRAEELAIKYHQIVRELKNAQEKVFFAEFTLD